MIGTSVYFLLATVAFGVIATPGLALLALVLVPAFGVLLVWRVLLFIVTRGHPSEVLLHAKRSHLLGPGGPDDAFASELHDDDEYSIQASTVRAA